MELKEKKVLVIGLARTGRECARFLLQQGAKVSISDLRNGAELSQEIASLAGLPLSYQLGGEEKSWLDGIDYVVPSPGVPMDNLLLREAVARKYPYSAKSSWRTATSMRRSWRSPALTAKARQLL